MGHSVQCVYCGCESQTHHVTPATLSLRCSCTNTNTCVSAGVFTPVCATATLTNTLISCREHQGSVSCPVSTLIPAHTHTHFSAALSWSRTADSCHVTVLLLSSSNICNPQLPWCTAANIIQPQRSTAGRHRSRQSDGMGPGRTGSDWVRPDGTAVHPETVL